MAKKNSSKTATEKSISASEPRIQVFKGWQGINIKDAPLGWEPRETGPHDHNQVDLKPNFLTLQNNLVTDDSLSVSTRFPSFLIGEPPDGWFFTGVAAMYDRWIFAAVRQAVGTGLDPNTSFVDRIIWKEISEPDENPIYHTSNWKSIRLRDLRSDAQDGYVDNPENYEITEIGFYEGKIIVMTLHKQDNDDGSETEDPSSRYEGEMFVGNLIHKKYLEPYATTGIKTINETLSVKSLSGANYRVSSPAFIPNPHDEAHTIVPDPGGPTWESNAPLLRAVRMGYADGIPPTTASDDNPFRYDVCFAWLNEVGSTMLSDVTTCYLNCEPVEFSSRKYLKISSFIPTGVVGVTGVDVWLSVMEKQEKALVGHIEFSSPTDGTTNKQWTVAWFGGMDDVSIYGNNMTFAPEENTTKGVNAAHFAAHDSRLYFWGNPSQPYRLSIGGNPGNELSVARGYGGGFIDIEPGTGIEIKGTAKWKTAGGASIVTMMCGNPNTGMVKRFNLVETNMTTTNEISSKSWMYEEVSNVVGCNSRWGYGVFADGLYSVTRYGLMLTTMAMEYNSQMRTTKVSEVIDPVFTELTGDRLKNCRMVYIDDVIYIALSDETSHNLDQVMLCYDMDTKAWYTFTHDELPNARGIGYDGEPNEQIHHIMSIDSDTYYEGLGVITDRQIRLYPTAGVDSGTLVPRPDPISGRIPDRRPIFNVILETGELAVRQPVQSHQWLHQLELRFDYFIGQCYVYVEGVDYYGRPFKISKLVNREDKPQEMRSYTEYINVSKLVETYRIRIEGQARFRLMSINAKVYTQSNRIGMPYGFDAGSDYRNRHGGAADEHHYIDSYNNLRRAIVT